MQFAPASLEEARSLLTAPVGWASCESAGRLCDSEGPLLGFAAREDASSMFARCGSACSNGSLHCPTDGGITYEVTLELENSDYLVRLTTENDTAVYTLRFFRLNEDTAVQLLPQTDDQPTRSLQAQPRTTF